MPASWIPELIVTGNMRMNEGMQALFTSIDYCVLELSDLRLRDLALLFPTKKRFSEHVELLLSEFINYVNKYAYLFVDDLKVAFRFSIF